MAVDGISTETWQNWMASIQTDRKLLIIDTCESADATKIALRRGRIAQEAAVDHIRRSLGRSIITAAREAAVEVENLKHGILTFAVLQALAREPTGGEYTTVGDIDEHVKKAVPALSEKLSVERLSRSTH